MFKICPKCESRFSAELAAGEPERCSACSECEHVDVETAIVILGADTMIRVLRALRSRVAIPEEHAGKICAALDTRLRQWFTSATTVAVDFDNASTRDVRIFRLGIDDGCRRVNRDAVLERCLADAIVDISSDAAAVHQ
jgi:hypothetical protein